MSKSMEIRLEGAFIGQSSDPKLQRLMFPWTGTQGPIINGKLLVNHREDVTLRSLTLTFKAKISCSWSERRGNSTVYYSAKKPLMEKQWVFLEKSESKLHLLRANQTYSYDFQLALPVNLPNSLAMSTGRIEYMFHANGKRSTFSLDLDRERLIEIYQALPPSHPHCIYPLQQTADFEQALNYLVQIPKKAFHHGSAIPITIKMRPLQGSGARWHVKDMHIKIKEYFWFISPGKGVRPEKRTLVETKQGSGNWPIQAGPVERILTIQVPGHNIMSTVDTEIIKCTHKLKILFSIEVNGSTRKLSADFDIYVPGPFPPGQGPVGSAPPPHMQIQQPPQQQHLYQHPLPPIPTQQATPPYQSYSAMGQPQPMTQQPMMQQPMQPPGVQQQFSPGMQQQQQQYPPYTPQPFAAPMPTPVMSPSNSSSVPSSSSGYSPALSYQAFSPSATPTHVQQQQQPAYPTPPAAGPSTPAPSSATPNPYSQGYPTPTAGHSYPVAVSSQGYPTPAVPSMPSPSATNASLPSYPLPPPPSPGKPAPLMASGSFTSAGEAPAAGTHISNRAPSPIPARHSSINPAPPMTSMVTSSPVPAPAAAAITPVVNYQEHYLVDSPKASEATSLLPSTGPGGLKYDDSIKVVAVPRDDTVKVNVDDIKVQSTPSTPAYSHAAAVVSNSAFAASPIPAVSTVGNGIISGGPAPSRNPQQRHSFIDTTAGVAGGSNVGQPQLVNGSYSQEYTPPPFATVPLQTGPQAPHAIKESDAEPSLYSYQPPPPSAPATSSTGSNGHHHNHPSNHPNLAANGGQNDQTDLLTHRFNQISMTSTLSHQASTSSNNSSSFGTGTNGHGAEGIVGGAASVSTSMGYVQPPSSLDSPLVKPKPSLSHSTSSASQYHQRHQQQQQQQHPMSPVSAAATGAIVASQQQQKQQQQQQQQQLQQQQQQTPKKQQVWIPMYQTLAGKTYVQYHPA